jgi:biotin-[acetyl-CoA-carboxylase] ligase BirA-like protein
MNVDRLQEGLQTKCFGKSIFFSHEVGSTSDWAKELARMGAEEGTVAIAEVQTAGRGRLGREWFSPAGGLYFSIVLRPRLCPSETIGVVFMAGLAVAEVLHVEYGLNVETKWPNDVMINGRKICGILSEMDTRGGEVSFVIVGIGLNVNSTSKVFPESMRKAATSLKDEIGHRVDLAELFRTLVDKLESRYADYLEGGLPPLLREWKRYATFLDREVEVVNQNEKWHGKALDIDHDGTLILKLDNGEIKHIIVGDLSLRKD